VVLCDTNLEVKAESLRAKVTKCGQDFCAMAGDFRKQGIACDAPKLIIGKEVGLDAVRGAVSAFPIDENDTLLFYYIGHGASVGRNHVLATSNGLITRDEMRAALRDAPRARPRLIVMMTECCADEKLGREMGLLESYGLSLDEKVPDKDLLGNLLLEHSGVVDVTSSSYDEFSHAGLFFDSVRRHMESPAQFASYDANGDGFVSWKEFFPAIARTTNALYQKSRVEGDQETQVPFAFSLGKGRGDVEPELYAANLGAYFTIVPKDFWYAAKLTRDPDPNTPAGRVGLRADDVLVTLDDLPIWGPVDVFGHHLDTKIKFDRNGQTKTLVADLPRETPFPPGVPKELYARNFAMSYQLMPIGKKFGARITRILPVNSPLKPADLVPGDILVLIDDEPIGSPRDVENHVRDTKIIYVDVRTGLVKKANVTLP
jgi:hypothetical protein